MMAQRQTQQPISHKKCAVREEKLSRNNKKETTSHFNLYVKIFLFFVASCWLLKMCAFHGKHFSVRALFKRYRPQNSSYPVNFSNIFNLNAGNWVKDEMYASYVTGDLFSFTLFYMLNVGWQMWNVITSREKTKRSHLHHNRIFFTVIIHDEYFLTAVAVLYASELLSLGFFFPGTRLFSDSFLFAFCVFQA